MLCITCASVCMHMYIHVYLIANEIIDFFLKKMIKDNKFQGNSQTLVNQGMCSTVWSS